MLWQVGTILACLMVPLKIGPDGWKIAAALTSRHIGGAVNYVAVRGAIHTLMNSRSYTYTMPAPHHAVNTDDVMGVVQVTETLHTSAELVAAGIAADNLVVSLYFALLFTVAGTHHHHHCHTDRPP